MMSDRAKKTKHRQNMQLREEIQRLRAAIYALDCLCGSLGSCQRNELLGELFNEECGTNGSDK
jgi:hypothetical protein